MPPSRNCLVTGVFLLAACIAVPLDLFAEETAKSIFRSQYQIADQSFCNSAVCVDFDNDGERELLFASRKTKQLQLLRAADGSTVWSKEFAGDQQSLSAFDLDADGTFEIVYTVSKPGLLYILDHQGNVLRKWDSNDGKLGNSPVIVDFDSDGVADPLELGLDDDNLALRSEFADTGEVAGQ